MTCQILLVDHRADLPELASRIHHAEGAESFPRRVTKWTLILVPRERLLLSGEPAGTALLDQLVGEAADVPPMAVMEYPSFRRSTTGNKNRPRPAGPADRERRHTNRTHSNRPASASAERRTPCSHKRTGTRRSAWFQRPDGGIRGRSALIPVASPFRSHDLAPEVLADCFS